MRKSWTPRRFRENQLNGVGWTLEKFESDLAAQENRCAICKRLIHNTPEIRDRFKACADHEHGGTGKPRGILCVGCNAGLGSFEDEPIRLLQAAAYILSYNKP